MIFEYFMIFLKGLALLFTVNNANSTIMPVRVENVDENKKQIDEFIQENKSKIAIITVKKRPPAVADDEIMDLHNKFDSTAEYDNVKLTCYIYPEDITSLEAPNFDYSVTDPQIIYDKDIAIVSRIAKRVIKNYFIEKRATVRDVDEVV